MKGGRECACMWVCQNLPPAACDLGWTTPTTQAPAPSAFVEYPARSYTAILRPSIKLKNALGAPAYVYRSNSDDGYVVHSSAATCADLLTTPVGIP